MKWKRTFAWSSYGEETIPMGPGERLIIYTDGVTEAADKTDEQFGEERLIELAEAHQASGYTIMEARGAGSAGLQTGALEGESSLLFMLAVPLEKLDEVLADVNRLVKRGHNLAVFISDTQVMRREKYS